MASKPLMTTVERAERHKRIVEAYRADPSIRRAAERFGMCKERVRQVVHLYGVARPRGRPRRAA